jgi:hypothetical protein
MLQVSTSLRFGRGKKLGGVSRWFLQGVLRILGCFVVVNRGEFVVNCVVDRGVLRDVFRGRKTRHFSGFIFEGFPFWEYDLRRYGLIVSCHWGRMNQFPKLFSCSHRAPAAMTFGMGCFPFP